MGSERISMNTISISCFVDASLPSQCATPCGPCYASPHPAYPPRALLERGFQGSTRTYARLCRFSGTTQILNPKPTKTSCSTRVCERSIHSKASPRPSTRDLMPRRQWPREELQELDSHFHLGRHGVRPLLQNRRRNLVIARAVDSRMSSKSSSRGAFDRKKSAASTSTPSESSSPSICAPPWPRASRRVARRASRKGGSLRQFARRRGRARVEKRVWANSIDFFRWISSRVRNPSIGSVDFTLVGHFLFTSPPTLVPTTRGAYKFTL